MKKLFLPLLFAVCIAGNASAQSSVWQKVNGHQPVASIKQTTYAKNYQLFQLDIAAIKQTLSQAGTSSAEAVSIALPQADGSIKTFNVWRDDVLAPELQAAYPDIRTYTAVDPLNTTLTAKLDVTVYGFRAMIYGALEGNFIIDPYSSQNTNYYMGFLAQDVDRSNMPSGVCGVTEAEQLKAGIGLPSSINPSGSGIATPMRAHGSIRRTYKLAMACTGEWAASVTGGAPTVPTVLAQITTMVNRCNGVYERELAVKMQLIASNNLVVYIDKDTDPFSCDNNKGCLINENQTNMLTVFPTPGAYDIGHIMSTEGGGLAQLNSVCSNTGSASGVSGGSPDYIGTILHEMGHQMGAPHTFNAGTGGCAGNGSAPSAYEPGSGVSLMSYNGLCAPNDLPGFSTDYYHQTSLAFITNHIQLGAGATCGLAAPGYTPVTVGIVNQNYSIPTNTPFELIAQEATASEPFPTIMYSWEQHDLGNFEQPEANGSSFDAGPTMTSLPPTTKRDRQFPPNELVSNNMYTAVGYRLSNVNRRMTFKLTTRSFFEGWGTFQYSDSVVGIDVLSGAPWRVTGPTVEELYAVGSMKTITWDTVATRIPPISCGFVNIYLSTNGGKTFPFIMVANAPNLGSYTFTVPDIYSDSIRFKVKGSGNIFYDLSKTSMKIHGDPTAIHQPIAGVVKGIKVYPNPASSLLKLRNTSLLTQALKVSFVNVTGQVLYQNDFTQNLDIDLSRFAKGNYFLVIADPASGSKRTEKIVVN